MADIINLREARKRLARAAKERKAAENRSRFGRTKAERSRTDAENARARADLDGKQRATGSDADDEEPPPGA